MRQEYEDRKSFEGRYWTLNWAVARYCLCPLIAISPILVAMLIFTLGPAFGCRVSAGESSNCGPLFEFAVVSGYITALFAFPIGAGLALIFAFFDIIGLIIRAFRKRRQAALKPNP